MVDRFAAGWRSADLDEPTVALLAYAEKLTQAPVSCGPDDVEELRRQGWDDHAISSATQVVAYFNYINRIAEGLGVDHEGWIDAAGRKLPERGGDGG